MGQDATPDPAEVPLGDGLADDPDDQAAADDEGLRWAALLAAFIDDALHLGPGAPPGAPVADPDALGET